MTVLALALLSLPFAHRAGAAPVNAEMAQFIAMGGNPSDLCGDTTLHPAGGCESCRIVDDTSMPAAASAPYFLLSVAMLDRGTTALTVTIPTHQYGFPPVRAPPAN